MWLDYILWQLVGSFFTPNIGPINCLYYVPIIKIFFWWRLPVLCIHNWALTDRLSKYDLRCDYGEEVCRYAIIPSCSLSNQWLKCPQQHNCSKVLAFLWKSTPQRRFLSPKNVIKMVAVPLSSPIGVPRAGNVHIILRQSEFSIEL